MNSSYKAVSVACIQCHALRITVTLFSGASDFTIYFIMAALNVKLIVVKTMDEGMLWYPNDNYKRGRTF